MRIAPFLVVLLLAAPAYATAGEVVFMEFLNSNLTFGPTNAEQYGWDLSAFAVDGFDDSGWDVWNTGYQAVTGPLDRQTPIVDMAGHVVGDEYVYRGGSFEIFYVLENASDRFTGSFAAPIERLTVWAGEREDDPVTLLYVLGAGLFDEVIAGALGISRHTTGGEAYAQLLLTDDVPRLLVTGADPTAQRHAWDGVNDIALDVPEPAALALLGASGAAWWVRRRRHTR